MVFTITTPLYYVNDKPHLGSTYTTIACDAIARYRRLKGEEVIFVTGVDEHGQKIQRTAESKNLEPQEHCDAITKNYRNLWKRFDITNDRFIRTTDKTHIEVVQEFFKRVNNSGDIRKGRQTGWYCVGCEEYKEVDKNNKSPICSIHQKSLEWRDEENLFFCLSKYQSQILDLITQEGFILPTKSKNEMISFVKNGLKDFSISRIDVSWGIPVPGHPGHTFYVWFDALLGYISSLFTNSEKVEFNQLINKGWPASVHIIGKDILRFHAIYWPAMLLSAGLELPKQVHGHGFLTREGKKMGKSLGNILDPIDLENAYGLDPIRWYLLRDINFGNDGDFQEKRFKELINNDLANTIGNMINRTVSMSRNWFNNSVPTVESNSGDVIGEQSIKSIKIYLKAMDIHDFQKACLAILDLASESNSYLNTQEPWKKIKNESLHAEVANNIYNVLESCRIIAYLLYPLLPEYSSKMYKQLNIECIDKKWAEQLKWGLLKPGTSLPPPQPIINKI